MNGGINMLGDQAFWDAHVAEKCIFDPYEVHFAEIDDDGDVMVVRADLCERLLKAYEALLARVG